MLLNLNARVYHVSGRWSYGFHGGYRPSISAGGELKPGTGLGGDYADLNWRNWLLQAFTVGPCIRRGMRGGGFVEFDGFYRAWWFNRKYIRFNNVEDISFDGLRSETTRVRALRLLWGGSSAPRFRDGKRSAIIIEGYGGIGYRWKDRSWRMHSGIHNGEIVQEQPGDADSSSPTLHLGLRLSLVVRAP